MHMAIRFVGRPPLILAAPQRYAAMELIALANQDVVLAHTMVA